MLSRTRRLTRRRRFLAGLVLGFAVLVTSVAPASPALRPYEPQFAQKPDYSHLPAEDRAAIFAPQGAEPAASTASGTGTDGTDWMRGIALATALIAASAFAVLMVRGGLRTAQSHS